MLSIIIATRNRPARLAATLGAVQAQGCAELCDVLVVDDASHPPIRPEALPAVEGLRVLRTERRRGPAWCRNLAAANAHGSVLGFLDDDGVPAATWVRVVLREVGGSCSAITGRVEAADHSLIARARQLRYEQRYAAVAGGQPVEFFAGGNSAIRRDVFLAAGGFPLLACASDNALMRNLRSAGYGCQFEPDLVICHEHDKGWREAIRQAWLSGASEPSRSSVSVRRMLRQTVAMWRAGRPDRPAALLNVGLLAVHVAGTRVHARRQ